MVTRAGFVCSALAGVLLLGCSSDGEGSDEGAGVAGFEVGFALTDFSPTAAELAVGNIYMGAYGILRARGAATGVHDPVYARAMAVASGHEKVVMVILDLPGMSNRFVRDVGQKASDETGLDPRQILIGATHSHSAPDFQGVWGGVPPDYRQRVVDLTAQAVVEAWNARVPAKLFVSEGTAANSNRRDWGITDTELVVLDAQDLQGTRIGTLVNFAAHPVTLGASNLEISRDYCGYTVDRLEQEWGGAPVLFFNGIQGDVSPSGATGDAFLKAESYGNIVAAGAMSAITAQTEVSPGLVRSILSFDHAVTNPAFLIMNDAGWLDYDFLAEQQGQFLVTTQVGYLRFGSEVQGVVFPGEALTRLGMAVKDIMTAPFRIWLGLTTDSLGYFVPHDEWQTGHNGDYEESVSIDEFVGEHTREVIVPEIETDNGKF